VKHTRTLLALGLSLSTLAVGCAGTQEGRAQLIAAAIDAAARDARTDAPSPERTRGALLIDFASLRRALPDSSLLMGELRRNVSTAAFRTANEAEAIRCVGSPVESCAIADDGVFVRLDRIAVTNGVADAVTTSISTLARGTTHTVVCPRQLLLKFRQEEGRWVQTDQSILSQC
jgi:hypothetical protein